jgi:hypothetical protein
MHRWRLAVADDILTRLRNPQLPCICIDVVLPSCHPCNARLDAADEIERLRAAGDALAQVVAWWGDGTTTGTAVLAGWEEARRER